jgi:16S rRNA (adenine1518-N6/adenine1519-N6)-dimethyltransferase
MFSGKETQLNHTDISPKRSLGQNFLVNLGVQKKVIAKMKELVSKAPEDNILEIGPGTGLLTQHLLNLKKPLLAMEIDNRAVEVLKKKFNHQNLLKIVQQDALQEIHEPTETLKHWQPFTLLSNLPFNVGSRILVDLAINFPQTSFSVILQKEVAQKLATDDITFFGAWCRLFWDCKLEFVIAKNNFLPAPKVDAALVSGMSLTAKKDSQNWICELDLEARQTICRIIKQLFVHPRKSLKNNLLNLSWTKPQVDSFMIKSGLSDNTRLTFENYKNIIKEVYFFDKNIDV